jgi:hypothetical protein
MSQQAIIYAQALNFTCTIEDKKVFITALAFSLCILLISMLATSYWKGTPKGAFSRINLITMFFCILGTGFYLQDQDRVCEFALINEKGTWMQKDVRTMFRPFEGVQLILIYDEHDKRWVATPPVDKLLMSPTNGR